MVNLPRGQDALRTPPSRIPTPHRWVHDQAWISQSRRVPVDHRQGRCGVGRTGITWAVPFLETKRAQVPEAQRGAAHPGPGAIFLREAKPLVLRWRTRSAKRAEEDSAHQRGIEVAMLTGDVPVANAALELQIDKVCRGATRRQPPTRTGDGPARATASTPVATADLGIAINRSDPRDIPRIITLSAATYRKMVQNLWLAAGYNIVASPLAAGVLAGWGILLTPAVGAILMSASTIVVSLNAQLLRRLQL